MKNSIFFALKVVVSTFIIGFAANVGAATENQYSPQDIFAFTRIGTVVVSPDSQQVAFVTMRLTHNDNEKIWRYGLFLKDVKGRVTQLVDSNEELSKPSWSPDGKQITYLAQGDKYKSIWSVSPVTRKAKKLYEFASNIKAYKWSPNGDYIIFVSYRPDKTGLLATKISAWAPENIQLFLINLDNYAPPKALPLTGKDISITQFDLPVADGTGFDWAPDSQSIVFAYQPRAGAEYVSQSKIAKLNLNNPIIEKISAAETRAAFQPIFSPDGKSIAFITMDANNNSLDGNPVMTNQVCVMDAATSKVQCLTNTTNQHPIILGWNAASDALYVMDWFKTDGMKIYSLDIHGISQPKLISDVPGYIDSMTVTLNRTHTTLGFGYETSNEPPEVYISPIDNFQLKKISNFPTLPSKTWGELKANHWKSSDGIIIEGFLMRKLKTPVEKAATPMLWHYAHLFAPKQQG